MNCLADMAPPLDNQLEHLREWVNGFETGHIFLTALDLDIFSRLKTPLTAEALAADCGLHAGLAEKFLNILWGMGLLYRENKQYGVPPDKAPFLMKDSPYFGRYLAPDTEQLSAFMRLKEVLMQGPLAGTSSGSVQARRFDRASMDWIARISLLGRLQTTVKQVVSLPEFSRAKKILDLGGGHGLFGIAFAQKNPQLHTVIFDKPEVIPVARDYIRQYGVTDRVSTLAGDYTKDDIGTGYDIIFEACSFAGDDSNISALFSKVASSLKANGLFIRLTFTLNNDRKGPLIPLIWNLKNHLVSGGQWSLMTEQQLFSHLSDAGLAGEKIIDLSQSDSSPFRLVISRKAA